MRDCRDVNRAGLAAVKSRRGAIGAMGGLLLACASPFSAAQAGFPTRPVRLVVPYPAGGPSDLTGRVLAQGLSELWGQPVVVDNKPGANEIIGAEIVAKAPADGLTLLLCSDAAVLYNQHLYKKLPYDPEKDLAPVSRIGVYRMVLVAHPSLPFTNMSELVAYARKNPGKLNYASAGVGGVTHLPMEWLKVRERLDINHVPYKGTAPAVQDVVAGNAHLTLGAASAMTQYVQAGSLKALAVSGPKRLPVLASVPNFTESGLPWLSADFMFAIMAPAKTAPAILQKIAADMGKVIASQPFVERVIGTTAMDPAAETPDAFAAFLARERPVAAEKVKVSGAKLD